MHKNRNRWMIYLVVAATMAAGSLAHAAIDDKKSLANVVQDSTDIVVVSVERISPTRPAAVFAVQQRLRGNAVPQRFPVRLDGNSREEANRILARLAEGQSIVLFLLVEEQGRCLGSGYVDGTWFQLHGAPAEGAISWRFQFCLPYMRGAYRDSTASLVELLTDALAGKREFPPFHTQPPELGPVVAAGEIPPNSDPLVNESEIGAIGVPPGETIDRGAATDVANTVLPAGAGESASRSTLGGAAWRWMGFAAICLFVVAMTCLVAYAPRGGHEAG